MKVVLLGTSGYHPNDRRQTSCVYLPEIGVMFDAGTGLYRIAEYEPSNHLNIFVTHAHLDHVIGLTYLYGCMSPEALPNVKVHGEATKLDAIRELLFAEALFPVPAPFQFVPIEEPIAVPGGGHVSYFPLEHPGGAIGYRLDFADRSMAYVTDTFARPDADYVDSIRGVDLLLHEANFATDNEMVRRTGHSHVLAAVEVAVASGVGELVLVHLDPRIESDDEIDLSTARRVFAKTRIGTDRMELEF